MNRKFLNSSLKSILISIFLYLILIGAICFFVFRDFESFKETFYDSFLYKQSYKLIFTGLKNTMIISTLGLLMGLIIGIIISVIEVNNSQSVIMLFVKKIINIYVSIMRGTPVTVQLLIIFFIVLASISSSYSTIVATIAFGLNSGAYVSEIIRGGINSVARGQMEAGRSLGLNYRQTMIRIIVPQAIKNSFPSIGNEYVTLIKETSVVGFIGAFDLTIAFQRIANRTYSYEMPYLVLGLTYFLIILLITVILKLIEGWMMRSDKY